MNIVTVICFLLVLSVHLILCYFPLKMKRDSLKDREIILIPPSVYFSLILRIVGHIRLAGKRHAIHGKCLDFNKHLTNSLMSTIHREIWNGLCRQEAFYTTWEHTHHWVGLERGLQEECGAQFWSQIITFISDMTMSKITKVERNTNSRMRDSQFKT